MFVFILSYSYMTLFLIKWISPWIFNRNLISNMQINIIDNKLRRITLRKVMVLFCYFACDPIKWFYNYLSILSWMVCLIYISLIWSNEIIWKILFSEKSYFMNYDFIDRRQHLNEWIRSKKYLLEAKCLINLPSSLLRIHHTTPQTKPLYFIIMYANSYKKLWSDIHFIF